MNPQTTLDTETVHSFRFGLYALRHYGDGTFWIDWIHREQELPLLGIRSPFPPLEIHTTHESHALFVRHISQQGEELTLWDQRIIEGVPVRWEILLSSPCHDEILLQAHLLAYGFLQAEVKFSLEFYGENLHTKCFSCPYPSATLVAERYTASVITLEPMNEADMLMEGGHRLAWTLRAAQPNRQGLHIRIRIAPAQSIRQAYIEHMQYQTTVCRAENMPFSALNLRALTQNAISWLLRPERQDHLAEDQIAFRVAPEDKRFSVYTIAAAKALLDWSRISGDETVLLTARLALNSAMEFQIINAHSNNSGACWDTRDEHRRGADIMGKPRFNLYHNARVFHHMLLLHRDTGSEIPARTALNGISWLLLKRGAAGIYDGAYVHSDGRVSGGSGKAIMGAITTAICSAYDLTGTEAYIHAANKLSERVALQCCEHLSPGTVLPTERFPELQDDVFAAASAIEGLVRLYRVYPHQHLADNAMRLMRWLSLWQLTRALDGFGEAGEVLVGEGLRRAFADTSIEAADGALWVFSLCRDHTWFAYATRALQAAGNYFDPLAGFSDSKLAYPDHTHVVAALVRTYLHWLLSIPMLAPDVECNFDRLLCRLHNRIFVPEPTLWQAIHVKARGLIDWVALACPATHDILLAVLTDGSSGAVQVDAGAHRRVVRDLLDGSTGTAFSLHPIPGVGSVGVYTLK